MRDRSSYYYFHRINTRWHDNDIYGHVNNVVYYSYFDTTANHYLVTQAEFDLHNAPIVGFVVASNCEYHSSIAFPDSIDVGLRVNKLGNKSVQYGLAIFCNDNDHASAHGTFTHVFVNRATGKSVVIPNTIRDKLQLILAP